MVANTMCTITSLYCHTNKSTAHNDDAGILLASVLGLRCWFAVVGALKTRIAMFPTDVIDVVTCCAVDGLHEVHIRQQTLN